MKKGFASALFITAAAAGAMAQSIGPEVGASEQFGILTLHRYLPVTSSELISLVPPLMFIYKHGR